MSESEPTMQHIQALAAEEQELREREGHGPLPEAERLRLSEIELELDQSWDLLRQRRARRNAGLDPDDAHERDIDTVEGYRQ